MRHWLRDSQPSEASREPSRAALRGCCYRSPTFPLRSFLSRCVPASLNNLPGHFNGLIILTRDLDQRECFVRVIRKPLKRSLIDECRELCATTFPRILPSRGRRRRTRPRSGVRAWLLISISDGGQGQIPTGERPSTGGGNHIFSECRNR